MKICVGVCEYNPFHNGHLVHLEKMKNSGCDCVALIMSGDFTQRGEVAVMDKYVRAAHAVTAGADIVFELPAVFATANAEIFCSGAVKLLDSLRGEKVLCFGAESGDKQSYLSAAKALFNETSEFKKLLKTQLKAGVSLAAAKIAAVESLDLGADPELIKNSNNILGVEYTKAILANGYKMDIMPIERLGAQYNQLELGKEISSATAIRVALADGRKKKTKGSLPPYVYSSLGDIPNVDDLMFYALLRDDRETLKKRLDVTEGLENRIKSAIRDCKNLGELREKVITKRYSAGRINRIFTASLLGVDENLIRRSLKSDLYLKVLAVKRERTDLLGSLAGEKTPIIARKSDYSALSASARECFAVDVLSADIFNYVSGAKNSEFYMALV